MKNRRAPSFPSRQQGVALVVVLILLLVVTLLGLASLRGTLLEERMSANLFDRSLSFQAVEAALREGEMKVSVENPQANFPASGCKVNLCAKPIITTGSTPRWLDTAFTGWAPVTTWDPGSLTAKPDYFIEFMGLAPGWLGCNRLRPRNPQCMKPRFRITARSAATGRAQVMLQSTFASP